MGADEGLNLSVARHAEQGSTKLEALLNKPMDEPPAAAAAVVASEATAANGEPAASPSEG